VKTPCATPCTRRGSKTNPKNAPRWSHKRHTCLC
jgi:hypothetical protein